jgi:hypothetical protein
MCRLESIVKKHGEFKSSVEKVKEEVEPGSGDTAYVAVLVVLFVTVSVLGCFSLKGVVVMGSSKLITMEVSAGCSTALCPDLTNGSRAPTACV